MLWVRSALVLATLFVIPALLEQFEAPKIAAVRVLGFGAIAWLLASGARRRIRLAACDVAVLAWLAIEALATLFSIEPRLSLMGETLQREGLLTSLALAGIYFAVRASHRDARDIGGSRDAFLVALTLSCVYAMIQAAKLDPIPWSRTAEFGGIVRPFGTLGHPNLLGAVTAAAVPLALSAFVAQPARRWVYGPATVLFGAAAVLGFSRGAWVALAAGTTLTMWWSRRELAPALLGTLAFGSRVSGPGTDVRPRASARTRLAALLAALAALIAGFAFTGWGRMFSERFASLLHPSTGASAARLEIWRSALAAWRDRPVLGQGPDTFQLVFPRFQTPHYWEIEWGGLPVQAHDVYLHVLATRGVLGVAALVAIALAFAPAARRALRDPEDRTLAAGAIGTLVALAAAGVFGAIGITGALVAFVAMGLVMTLAGYAPESAAAPAPAREPRRRGVAFAICAGVVALTIAAEAHELVASRLTMEARALAPVNPAIAEAASRQAWRMRPFDTTIAGGRVETLILASMTDPDALSEAERVARAALRLEPGRLDTERLLGRVLALRAARGEVPPDSMAEHYERAFALAPVDPLVRVECAHFALLAGNPRFAESAALDATALFPRESSAWALVARARAAQHDLAGTTRALALAREGEWRGDEVGRARVEQAWSIAVLADTTTAKPR